MRVARVAAMLAVMILVGCGSSATRPEAALPSPTAPCRPIYAALNLSPSDAASADSEGRCLPQKLSFTGEVAGHVRVAEVTSLCTKPLGRGDSPPSPELQMIIGGKPYSLAILLSPAYDPQRPTVPAGPNRSDAQVRVIDQARLGTDPPWVATRGTVTFNPDGTNGTVSVDLMRNVSGAQPGHVSGDWRCGTPAASPSPAAGPCGTLASSPGLQPEDVPRLQAASCLTEDLTLTNPVSGRADHGVGVEPSISVFKDVPCGGSDDHHYISSVAFRIQNETFFFVIELVADSSSPPFQPGDYGPLVPNALTDTPSAYVVSGSTKWAAHNGKFAIAQDQHSGTVDMNFLRDVTGESVHLAGSWRCAQ